MAGKSGTHNTISGGIFFSAVVQGRDITVQLPSEITPALSGLPPGTPAFTGRDADLRALLDILAPRSDESRDNETAVASPPSTVVTMGGLAGIGKTELAIQAARAALSWGWFPGGVLFVDLYGYDPVRSLGPGQALEGFLRALAIPGEHIPPQAQDRARLYASVLAAYAREGRRILVVIDNAATYEQVKPVLPADSVSAAIVTSRNTLAMLGARLLELGTLTPENATQMLEHALRAARPGDTRVTDHPGDAARIAQLCGGLPLALRIIAAILSENLHRPLAEMAIDLDDERTRLDELSYADTDIDTAACAASDWSVRAAFDLSYQRLNGDGQRLFRLLTVNPGPEISTQATVVLADVDPPVARRGLEALARAHLIDHGSSYGRWRMHDLLRLYARQLSDAEAAADAREQAVDRLLSYYLDRAHAAYAHMRALAGAPVPADFGGREDALTWLDAERPCLVAAVALAASTGRDQVAVGLSLNLGEYLSWRRRFDDGLAIMTTSRDAARRLGDRGSEAGALNNLGLTLMEVRRFKEATTALQDAAAIYRETGDRHSEGMALGNLGRALVEVRRFKEGITALQDAAAILRETRDRHGVGMALTGLGVALSHVQRFEDAITAHQEAAAIFRKTGDRPGEGMALNNLGKALVGVWRFKDAITAHQKAAAIYRETADRHREGSALINLGVALRGVRRFKDAITAHQEAAAIYRETADRYHEDMALNNLELDRTAQNREIDRGDTTGRCLKHWPGHIGGTSI